MIARETLKTVEKRMADDIAGCTCAQCRPCEGCLRVARLLDWIQKLISVLK